MGNFLTMCVEPSENPAQEQEIDEDPSHELFEEAMEEREEDIATEDDVKSTEVLEEALENHEVLKEALETKTPHENQNPVQSHTSSHLPRLSLPKFSGKRRDYFQFKREFHSLVNYETEDLKILALQCICLQTEEDQRKVANESTLEGCFEKLDKK